MAHLERVIVLVDMDCFYCQVEENLNHNLLGKPIAVVQYNAWRGGGIIAVNYPARDCGVTRHMRGNEAKEKCPQIQLVKVPNVRGKADLTKYREAGKKVAEVLQSFTSLLERASVDEAYLDITESVYNRMKFVDRIHPLQLKNTHVVNYESVDSYLSTIYSNELMNESNIKLAWGGVIAEEIRAAVLERTGYKCSAGVAHNKILAKLVAGMHKPNQQTVLPHASVPFLYETMPVRKIRSLGGKFGNHLSEKLGIQNMGELCMYSEKELARHFDEKTASWLYNIARGIDNEPVTVRLVSKSIGCCKKFPGRTALTNHDDVKHWLNELAIEISERLEKDVEENNRKAKQMVVNFAQEVNRKDISGSRSHILNSYDATRIMSDAYEVIKKNCLRADDSFCIKFLGISVGKFEDVKNVNSIASFFNNCSKGRKSVEAFNVNENQNQGDSDQKIKEGTVKEDRDGKINNIYPLTKLNDVEEQDSSIAVGRNVLKENQSKSRNGNSVASFFLNYTNPKNSSSIEHTREGNNSENTFLHSTPRKKHCFDKSIISGDRHLKEGNNNKHIAPDSVHRTKDLINTSVDNTESSDHLIDACVQSSSNTGVISNLKDYDSISNFSTNQESNLIKDENSDDPLKSSKTCFNLTKDNIENSDNSNDSITEELHQSDNNTSSFFNKYMEKLQHPAERNFDTSLVLDQERFDTGIDEILNDEVIESSQHVERPKLKFIVNEEESTSPDEFINPTIRTNTFELNNENITAGPFSHSSLETSRMSEVIDDGCEICLECNKRILLSEFVSHMDYHFALKIVRDEADLYKPVKVEKTVSPKKSNKRKSSAPDKYMKLTSFLTSKTEAEDTGPKEICEECNKSIPIENFASHIDYHVAKRIHLELNNFNTSDDKTVSKINVKKCDNKSSIKSSVKKDKGRSIATFFKPV